MLVVLAVVMVALCIKITFKLAFGKKSGGLVGRACDSWNFFEPGSRNCIDCTLSAVSENQSLYSKTL